MVGVRVPVLLHGGAATGRQWDWVIPFITGPALAPNVPGRLDRPADLARLSIAQVVDSIGGDIDGAGVDSVVLVAHSSGGLLVPGLIDRLSGRVDGVVWIAAGIPLDGGSGLDCMQARHRVALVEAREAAQSSGAGLVTSARQHDPERVLAAYGGEPLTADQLTFVLDPVRWVDDSQNLYFEPLRMTAVADLPRLYVRLLHDRVVPIELQDEMIRRLPGTPSVTLDSGHLPMVTDPQAVAAIIDRFAADLT